MRNIVDAPYFSRGNRIGIIVLFGVALAFHAWGISVGWKSLNLPGCEFRQTQTALSAFFIQKENNFSLAYPTPVLGKPWSVPFEFPLYQWTVVGVANTTGWSLTSSGRAVSAACFYLTLPALFLLLGNLGVSRPGRLLALGLVLTCPLYIFYARAFLIETMALLFGAWFLLGYVRANEERQVRWLLVAAVAGAGGGLVKVTTLLFFLSLAVGWTVVWFWRDWHAPERWRAMLRRSLWCAGAVVVPCVASIWWVRYADAIKAASLNGSALTSEKLITYNFGIGVRFSAELWRAHWQILFQELTSWSVVAGCGLLAVVFARRVGWLVLGLLAAFFAVQVVFPILYSWHAYYYVANAFALMFALGLVLGELFGSRLPGPAVWLLVLGVYGMQMWSYLGYYYPGQKGMSPGGNTMTLALRQVTMPDEVLLIAGDDWNSSTPYYAQRRAYMLRRTAETDWDAILPSTRLLEGEEVTALVLHGAQINNHMLIRIAGERFQIDPRPAFRWGDATVFLHRQIRHQAQPTLKAIPDLEVFDLEPVEAPDRVRLTNETLRRYRDILPSFEDGRSPEPIRPIKFSSTYGIDHAEYEGRRFLMAHPDLHLWFALRPGKQVFSADAMLDPAAYDSTVPPGGRSDGIEVRLESEGPDGARTVLFSRTINPRDNPADAGMQHLTHSFELSDSHMVVLSVGPGAQGNSSRDWAVLGGVKFQ